ncbi:MAG TPA: hypothetical protein ENI78_01555 [Euryarchaeota archaeon]|nr:hypothetical protein [Euryarchaeota archaeon]
MKVTTKEVQKVAQILDDIIDEYKKQSPQKKTGLETYEQRLTERIRTAVRELEPLIEEAISTFMSKKGEERQKA